ncbi:MAG: tRNA pseudouridine(55) synthase TruB [Sphingomicrobium sp.]
MLNGWIILDKPVGLGSTTAVSAVKRILRQSGEPKTKVGHGGTLDPLASGVLPIALGEATKLCGRMLDATKAYDFTIRFGEETDTLDAEGELVGSSDARPGADEVQALIPHFTGLLEQVPPIYSALKIEGKAAYARARAGEKIQLKSRRVEIFDLLLIDMSSDSATFSATVSKGTYIRSLARDIAHALGTLGHVSYLRRTSAGPFSLASAMSLDILEEAAKARALTRTVLPLEAALDDIPALPVTTRQAEMLRKGQRLAGFPAKPGLGLATLEGTPVALVEALADGLRVVRGFNL